MVCWLTDTSVTISGESSFTGAEDFAVRLSAVGCSATASVVYCTQVCMWCCTKVTYVHAVIEIHMQCCFHRTL